MGDKSGIQWCDATWNPVRGCSVVSPGCTNCYAMKQAHRFSHGEAYGGLTEVTKGGPVWTGVVRTVPEKLDQPLRWRRPRRIFVNSMSDLFHEGVPFGFIDSVFAVMALASRHTFQVLTKRPERMRDYMTSAAERVRCERGEIARSIENEWTKSELLTCYAATDSEHATREQWPPRNVHLGVSVEDQARADQRIPLLLETPAAVRFLSVEPLLGAVDLRGMALPAVYDTDAGGNDLWKPKPDEGIDWVIVGGESGPGARACDVAWIRSIVEQCKAASVPAFVKQLGSRWAYEQREVEWANGTRRRIDGKGGGPSEWPEDLRVREFPNSGERR